jgi:hypothetical protein
MKRFFLAFCIALASAPLPATEPVEKIQAMLAKPKVMCGQFDQTKTLAGINKPLLSYGRFCVAAGKGILWRTLQPFPNTLRLTRDEIAHFQGERLALRIDAQQEPTVRLINGVLFSLLAGDLSQLEKLFEVDGSIRDKHWNVSLKAREPALAKAIGSIALNGGEYVKTITISEANGDRTGIVFSNIATGDSAISKEEAALF